jgi:hypothetical protein
MSHELDDNIERRQRILAKIRQNPRGVGVMKLTRIIMDMGYNLRGAKDKLKEMSYGGWIKEQNGFWFDADTLSHTHARRKEEGNGKVAKGSEQEVE